MIVYKWEVEDLENGTTLFASKELAKRCAELSMLDSVRDWYAPTHEHDADKWGPLPRNTPVEFIWKHDSEIIVTDESLEKGIKPRTEREVPEERLYIKVGDGPEETTAFIVGPVEVLESPPDALLGLWLENPEEDKQTE